MSDRVEITVLSGVSAGDVFRFDIVPGGNITVGRAEDCDLVLQDPTVSRRHAKILRTSTQGVFLEDLGSTHGTTHMGFQLKAGADGQRALHNGDEFKVGQALFRIHYEENIRASAEDVAAVAADITGVKRHHSMKGKKYSLIATGALGVVLIGALFWPEEKKGGPTQLSNVVLTIPQERVIGNLSVGSGPGQTDRSHLDLAQFELPIADSLVEFDYFTEVPIEVKIDEATITKLQPTNSVGFQKRVILTREVYSGLQRRLVFDNLEYPQKANPGAKPKSWGVSGIRATPLLRDVNPSYLRELEFARTAAEKMHLTPDGVFSFLRATQRAILEGLRQGNLDAIDYPVVTEGELPTPEEFVRQLTILIDEQKSGLAGSNTVQSLQKLGELGGKVDGELWKKANLALFLAERLSKQKKYIEAYDAIAGVQVLFPKDQDYRWTLGERLMMDKKIIPPRIRKNPNKYRKDQE